MELLYIVNKELVSELNNKLVDLINNNSMNGDEIMALVNKYPDGYKLPKLMTRMVNQLMETHEKFLLENGDILNTCKTEIKELERLLQK